MLQEVALPLIGSSCCSWKLYGSPCITSIGDKYSYIAISIRLSGFVGTSGVGSIAFPIIKIALPYHHNQPQFQYIDILLDILDIGDILVIFQVTGYILIVPSLIFAGIFV